MKKILLAISLIIGSLTFLQAQDATKKEARFRHHRIFFGGSIFDLSVQNALNYKVDNAVIDQQYGAGLMAGYEYKFNKRISLALEAYGSGAGAGYDHETKGSLKAGYISSNYLLKMRYSWLYRPFKKSFFRMYSGLGAGVTNTILVFDDVLYPDITEGIGFGYQVDAIGAEISFSWFGLWIEGGYGNQGNVKAGISFNFKK